MWLADVEALYEFQREFSGRSGNTVAMEYLQRGRVRGFYNSEGRLVSGYVVNARAPFRYRDWVPAERQGELSFLDENEPHFCEWTCIYFDESISKVQRAFIYLRGIVDLLLTGKRYLLGGAVHRPIMMQQTAVLDRPLYSGPTTLVGKSTAYLYYGTRISTIRQFVPTVANYVVGRQRRNAAIFP